MTTKTQTLKYVLFDFFGALLGWSFFFAYRKLSIESLAFGFDIPVEFNSKFILGLISIPVFWIFLYYASGYYNDIYKKSRLNEFGQTFLITLIGVIFIFFTLILDDTITSYKDYYYSISALFTFHFTFTYIPRLIITSVTIQKIQKRKIGFNTIIIGGSHKALDIYKDIENQIKSSGNKILGFIHVKNGYKPTLEKHIPCLGNTDNLEEIVKEKNIEEIIIAIESNEHDKIGDIINMLNRLNVIIKAIPDMFDILTGHVKISNIFGAPLIQITNEPIPQWQKTIKNFIDIVISFLALLILLPFSIAIGIIIKLTSKGPIFYSHERIGRYGKPFNLYKFRSMYVNAEEDGPQLSNKKDKRITSIGRFLRRTRLDEIPNFINVLKGDMSLVGPRPERQYYIDLITQKAPHYYQLQQVKPGITSLGQVKYGYATNVDEMIKRLRYDIIYIKNMSLFIDFQILIYTLSTILKGKGL